MDALASAPRSDVNAGIVENHDNAGIAEEWRPVVGWEGRYEVSSLGRVRSMDRSSQQTNRWGTLVGYRRKGRIIATHTTRYGSAAVTLHRPGCVWRPRISDLVVRAFLPDWGSDQAPFHLNGNRSDARLSNLSEDIPPPPDLDGEHWRPVLGWENLYLVSSMGRVKSLPRRVGVERHRRWAGKILTQTSNSDGYPAVKLQGNGRKRNALTHVLVCEAFIGPRPEGSEARHLNGDRQDASATNLAWGSKVENERDKVFTGFAALAGISVDQVKAIIANLQMEHNCT